jgi:hypothetical protein
MAFDGSCLSFDACRLSVGYRLQRGFKRERGENKHAVVGREGPQARRGGGNYS